MNPTHNVKPYVSNSEIANQAMDDCSQETATSQTRTYIELFLCCVKITNMETEQKSETTYGRFYVERM
jgi:hypothetical protein